MKRCLHALHDLEGDRHSSMAGWGAIPHTAVLLWCENKDVGPDLTELILAVLLKLDNDRAERIASARSLNR